MRGFLFRGVFVSVALTVLFFATRATRNGIAGGPVSFVVLFILALVAQRLAERRGTPERERRRREEWEDIPGWPCWKRIALLTVGAPSR